MTNVVYETRIVEVERRYEKGVLVFRRIEPRTQWYSASGEIEPEATWRNLNPHLYKHG